MASGPHHYREAEKHLGWACGDVTEEAGRYHLATAQAHATLALAAATALNDHVHTAGGESVGGMPVQDWDAWKAVAAVQPEGGEGR